MNSVPCRTTPSSARQQTMCHIVVIVPIDPLCSWWTQGCPESFLKVDPQSLRDRGRNCYQKLSIPLSSATDWWTETLTSCDGPGPLLCLESAFSQCTLVLFPRLGLALIQSIDDDVVTIAWHYVKRKHEDVPQELQWLPKFLFDRSKFSFDSTDHVFPGGKDRNE